jgi:hypothetical protein
MQSKRKPRTCRGFQTGDLRETPRDQGALDAPRYYPKAQIRQGADWDSSEVVAHPNAARLTSLRLANQINGLSDRFPFRARIETIDELQFVGTPNLHHHSPSRLTFPRGAIKDAFAARSTPRAPPRLTRRMSNLSCLSNSWCSTPFRRLCRDQHFDVRRTPSFADASEFGSRDSSRDNILSNSVVGPDGASVRRLAPRRRWRRLMMQSTRPLSKKCTPCGKLTTGLFKSHAGGGCGVLFRGVAS